MLVVVDVFMIIMRDADLWDEAGKLLVNIFGDRLGKGLKLMIAVTAGETDLAANAMDDEQEHLEGSKTRRRNFIKVRMVASVTSQAICCL